MKVKHVGIDAVTREDVEHIGSVMKRAGFKGINRTLEQNDCLHKWCRLIRDHLAAEGNVLLTEETVKELILNGLGYTREITVPGMETQKIAMRSSKYKSTDADLSEKEKRLGFISMNELLNKVEAWAATDLNLTLGEKNEQH